MIVMSEIQLRLAAEAWELARLTKLPIKYAARTTTGTGISYMQMELAHRDGVLIPEQKAEPEDPKRPDELLVCSDYILLLPSQPSCRFLYRRAAFCSAGKNVRESHSQILIPLQRARSDRQHTFVAHIDYASPTEKVRYLQSEY